MKVQKGILRQKALETKAVDAPESVETGKFALDNLGRAQQHIMNVLTNMYSDPYRATVQETLSNAYDSHKRAGNTVDAIEMYLTDDKGQVLTDAQIKTYSDSYVRSRLRTVRASIFAPPTPSKVDISGKEQFTFTVRDFGTGMDRNELETKFFLYGGTDKRSSAEERGGFGLGCKAGLSLLGRIEVISVKNGIKTRAIGVMNEEENKVEYYDLGETSDADGTTVITPFLAENIGRMDKAMSSPHLRIFWDSTPLKINGQMWDHSTSIVMNPEKNGWTAVPGGDTWFKPIPDNGSYSGEQELHINLGGVAYPVNTREPKIAELISSLGFARHYLTYGLSFTVPMTSLVSLTPSRESILYDDNTVSNLTSLISEKISLVEGYVETHVNSFDNPRDASLWIMKNVNVLMRNTWNRPAWGSDFVRNITWRGEKIFVSPKFSDFVSYVASSRTIKNSKFTEVEDWKSSIKGLKHPAFGEVRESGHKRTILVVTPKDYLEDKKQLQRVSLSCRTLASFGDSETDWFNETNKCVFMNTERDSVIYHFTEDSSQITKSDILSYYAKIVNVEDLLSEGERIREANKPTKVKIDQSVVPRHVVLSSSNLSSPKTVSDSFLQDKNVIIITKEIIHKEEIQTYLTYAKMQELNEIAPEMVIRWNNYKTRMSNKLNVLAELYPNSYFLILSPTRKVGPVYKAIPNAKHAWVKAVEETDFSDVEMYERMAINLKWNKEVTVIKQTSEVLKYPKTYQLTKTLTAAKAEIGERQRKIFEELYLSFVDSLLEDSTLQDIMGAKHEKFYYESHHMSNNAENSDRINVIRLLLNLRFNLFGGNIRFKPTSEFRFFHVMRIPEYVNIEAITHTSPEGLVASIIENMIKD